MENQEFLVVHDRAVAAEIEDGRLGADRFVHQPVVCGLCPLGSVTELPAPLWSELSILLQQWMDDDRKQYPNASPTEFFRRHHAMISRRITP
jgi:hypothetical protein